MRPSLEGGRTCAPSFVLVVNALSVSLFSVQNPHFRSHRLLSVGVCAAYSLMETCRRWPRTFSGPRFSASHKAGRRRFPPACTGPIAQCCGLAPYGCGSPFFLWKKEFHPCVCASWERSSLCASACCLPAVTGNAGVVVGLSAIPLVVARASRAAAGAAVALAATPPTKAPWRPPWRLLLDPCQPLSRRADCITKECLTTEADHLLPLGFPRYLDKSRSLRERPTLGAAPWTSLASARTSWSACASVA